jgi:hypothetical protein
MGTPLAGHQISGGLFAAEPSLFRATRRCN